VRQEVDAGHPRTVRTSSNEDTVLQLWNESRGEARVIPHENWDYPNGGPRSNSWRSVASIPLLVALVV
jgi:hypothetical protein